MSAHPGFHEGELAMQRRAGVAREASRLEGMLMPGDLSGGAQAFLADRELAVLTARDGSGRLWTSPLVGSPGFLDADGSTLRVHGAPGGLDPLDSLPAGQAAGLVAIDLATRRRVRVNGLLTSVAPGRLEVSVQQAYGNCPKYIHGRRIAGVDGRDNGPTASWARSARLSAAAAALVRSADTFFLGTVHPERGVDSSHRGGAPGFVRVDGDSLWWPDYPGNNMFNSFGNLAVDDSAALFFVDFATGTTVQLSGHAAVEWTVAGAAGDDGGTGRRVRFSWDEVVTGRVAALRAERLTA
jgi:predicted pyridoxine 5'-phosphate oxidase superfamily flavin-nucleotide-binding protein